MAYSTTAQAPVTAPGSTLRLLARPFVAFFDLLVRVGEASGRMQAITKLNETSDVDLAARGVTRESEVHRILGNSYYG